LGVGDKKKNINHPLGATKVGLGFVPRGGEKKGKGGFQSPVGEGLVRGKRGKEGEPPGKKTQKKHTTKGGTNGVQKAKKKSPQFKPGKKKKEGEKKGGALKKNRGAWLEKKKQTEKLRETKKKKQGKDEGEISPGRWKLHGKKKS